MNRKLVKITNSRGQARVCIPKVLAKETGMDKEEYAWIWKTGKKEIGIKATGMKGVESGKYRENRD